MTLKPYYQDEFCTLYHGDSKKILQEISDSHLTFDLVISDPPYGINFQSNGAKKKRFEKLKNDDKFNLSEYWYLIEKIVKDTSAVYLYSRWDVAYIWQEVMKPNHQIIIPRGRVGMGDLKNFATDYEVVLFKQYKNHKLDATPLKIKNNSHVKNPPPFKSRIGALWTDAISNQAWEHSEHPTQKTVSSIEKMLMISSQEGFSVIDPFAGSGTTLVASKGLKRHCVGIEIEEKYCEVIAKKCDKIIVL